MLMNESLQEVAEHAGFQGVDREYLTLTEMKCSCFKANVDW